MGLPRNVINKTKPKNLYKKYKIDEFTWDHGSVQMDEFSFSIKSDDNNAKLKLSKDLYRVMVSYLQRTWERRVGEGGGKIGTNPRKQLL